MWSLRPEKVTESVISCTGLTDRVGKKKPSFGQQEHCLETSSLVNFSSPPYKPHHPPAASPTLFKNFPVKWEGERGTVSAHSWACTDNSEGISKELVCGQQRKRKRAQNCKQEKEIRACNDVKKPEQRTDALFHDCSKQCYLDRCWHQRQ